MFQSWKRGRRGGEVERWKGKQEEQARWYNFAEIHHNQLLRKHKWLASSQNLKTGSREHFRKLCYYYLPDIFDICFELIIWVFEWP